MIRYVAFLRAINVAGHARVEMSRLRQVFLRAGCANPQTYIRSGNVIFEADNEDCAPLFEAVRSRVRRLTGEQSTVVFRSERELRSLIKAAPFKALESDRALKLYAVCLAGKPRKIPRFPWHDPRSGSRRSASRG